MMRAHLKDRWNQPNGYREVLEVSLPLILSMIATTVMSFTDRVFLGWYSMEAISAALPSFIAIFTFIAFFMGTAEYLNVFISQHIGSGETHEVGTYLWQGIHFSAIAAVLLAGLYLLAPPLFDLAGHPAEIRELEIIYFRILALGGGFLILGITLSCFYSGRGLTRVVMFVNIAGALINIPLDYALINGLTVNGTLVLPELGIAGAAIATAAAWAVIAACYCVLIFRRENENRYRVFSQWRLQPASFIQFMKYGLPGGVEFFLDILAITCFCFLVGRLGKLELAATNIVFSLHSLIFLPLLGLHVGISVLTGHAIGRGRPEQAERVVTSAIHLNLAYITVIGTIFILLPEPLMLLFKSRGHTAAAYSPIISTGIVLLRFLVFFTFFDGFTLVYLGVLKGAGDIYFVMWVIGLCAVFVLALPSYLGIHFMHFNLYAAWSVLTAYICVLSFIFYLRFKQGTWKTMSVIRR